MSESSESDWDISQTDLFDKLDVGFTIILIVAGILTFPPAIVVYWKILTMKSFQSHYLMKLFVLNGASNVLIYIVNLNAVQFCNWPSMFVFYSWLKDSFLSLVFRFLQDFSLCLMWQTTFFISLNRLISLKNQYLLNKYDFHYFLIASISSLLVSAAISVPLFFSHYVYTVFPVGNGTFGYIPYIPEQYKALDTRRNKVRWNQSQSQDYTHHENNRFCTVLILLYIFR